jgi:cell division protein FtsZ
MKKKQKPKKQKKQASGDTSLATVKVVGVGGGGGNAVSRMSRDFSRGVDLIAINTDRQDLAQTNVKKKIHIGRNLTRGLGTGMNPDIGRQAAEENRSEIAEALHGADLVFVTAGLGGGTGTGAAPVVAETAKQAGALTIGVVTKPFAFEGAQRERVAQEGILRLKDKVDALIVVPNDRIFSVISKDTPILKAFQAIDDVLKNALRGIVDFIVAPGIVNVDFADVRTVIQDAGSAVVGVGVAGGGDRAVAAVKEALSCPLLEATPEGARGVLLGVSGGRDLRMTEINEAARLVAQTVDPGARIIFGAYYDKDLRPNQVKITLIATGFGGNGGSATSLFGSQMYENRSSILSNLKQDTAASKPSGRDDASDAGAGAKGAASHAASGSVTAKPAFQVSKKAEEKKQSHSDSWDWDVPAFLRKKKR